MTGSLAVAPRPLIDWGISARTYEGEIESGDAYVVAPFPGGVLVAVIDGLGHGAEAATAARAAVATLQEHAEEPVIDLLPRCHEALRKTRGAALSLASFQAVTGTMTWLGVGNVEGALFRVDRTARHPRDSLMLRGGVVGYRLPPLRAASHAVFAGDMLTFATDGIAGGFHAHAPLGRSPQDMADEIQLRYGKKTDDALVLVATYLGDAFRGAPR